MKSKGVPTDLLMKSTSLFSYTATLEEYRTKIIGIDYRNNENDKELRKTPQEPTYFTIQDLLLNWPADNTNPSYWAKSKAHPLNSKNDYIARFDYSDLLSRSLAEEYRRKEIPFILTNVKELADAAEDSFSLQNLLSSFGTASKVVEHSATNHFTYYVDKPSVIKDIDPTWTPPQVEEKMPFPSFLHLAEEAEKGINNDWANSSSLYYMTISASEGRRTPFIRKALPFFTSEKGSTFFIVDPSGFKGINCRFGMKGVIAAAHYDGARNFVAMLRGRKRYILLPPSSCDKLELLPRGHPSARHSAFDWSDPEEVLKHPRFLSASATEVVLSMGEMLYIPSYWFHYIVSQDASIQCNARSGNGDVGRDEITQCGFYSSSSSSSASAEEKRSGKVKATKKGNVKKQQLWGDRWGEAGGERGVREWEGETGVKRLQKDGGREGMEGEGEGEGEGQVEEEGEIKKTSRKRKRPPVKMDWNFNQ